jgi:cyclophilin family peptidyl-prolyl cis-trans isomerase
VAKLLEAKNPKLSKHTQVVCSGDGAIGSPDSASSQFYIVSAGRQQSLDGDYALYWLCGLKDGSCHKIGD